MKLLDFVNKRFGGKLLMGSHLPDGKACILEACSIAKGLDWTDSPATVGLPDLRQINDAPWPSDVERAHELCAVADSLWSWPEWSEGMRRRWARGVALRTIREVLPLALEAVGLGDQAIACRAAKDLAAAAASAAAAEILRLACRIWREEAEKSATQNGN